MMWMLIGLGSVFGAAHAAVVHPDSASVVQLQERLPEELRARVNQARADLQAHHDTLSRLSPSEKSQWLDSLRRQAKERRTTALEKLTPDERSRVEARLRDLEHQIQIRKQGNPSNPGYRQ